MRDYYIKDPKINYETELTKMMIHCRRNDSDSYYDAWRIFQVRTCTLERDVF